MMRAGKPENAEECAKMKLFMSNINKKTSFFLQEFIALWEIGKRNLITRISIRYGYDFILYNFSFIPSLNLFSLSIESYPVTHTHTHVYI